MKRQKIVAIHQPNFFPWLGYFDKIAKADCFVFLDHVALNPDQTWVKRVQVLNNKAAHWLTVPTKNGSTGGSSKTSFPRINEIQVSGTPPFEAKHLRVIEFNYRKAPCFNEVFPYVKQFYSSGELSLAKRNRVAIDGFCEALELKTERLLSSSMECTQSSNELLIEIIQKVSGTAYLCGGGATGYQLDERFVAAGINVQYQQFKHPSYSQLGSENFIPGLSIIDVLMNWGFDATRNYLNRL